MKQTDDGYYWIIIIIYYCIDQKIQRISISLHIITLSTSVFFYSTNFFIRSFFYCLVSHVEASLAAFCGFESIWEKIHMFDCRKNQISFLFENNLHGYIYLFLAFYIDIADSYEFTKLGAAHLHMVCIPLAIDVAFVLQSGHLLLHECTFPRWFPSNIVCHSWCTPLRLHTTVCRPRTQQ